MSRGPRTATVMLATLGGALLFIPLQSDVAVAGCAGPQLTIEGEGSPATFLTGSDLTVEGSFFVEGCDDTGGSNIFGCEDEPAEVEAPMRDVDLVLKQRGHEWVLGTSDAGAGDRLGEITWTVVIPDDVSLGSARLVASYSEPLRIRIRADGG